MFLLISQSSFVAYVRQELFKGNQIMFIYSPHRNVLLSAAEYQMR